MRKPGIFAAMLVCAVFAATTQAGVISVGLDYVSTAYDAGTQQLTMADSGLLVILTNDDQSQNAIFNTKFNLDSTLDDGFVFAGGTFELTDDAETTTYLSGTVETIIFDYSDTNGTLSGSGTAEVLVENLDGDLLGPAEIVTITFNLPGIVDFSESFEGDSKVNFLVPEPATMVLLGLGGILLRRKK